MSCPDCFRGHEHQGEPKGKETTIHGRTTYVSEPENGLSPKGIIIIIPDAYGLPFVNNKLLADHYVSQGQYLVYLPDFMDGTAASITMIDYIANVTSGAWLWKPYYLVRLLAGLTPFMISNRFSISWPKVTSFFEAVRTNEAKDLPVGAAGFCWGGKHTVNLAHGTLSSDGKPLVDAGFTAHPSGLDIPGELVKVTKPLSIAVGDKDIALNIAQVGQIKTTFEEISTKCEITVYEGAGHGFAIRADPGNEKVVDQSIAAEEQAIHWFKQVFATTDYGGK